MGYRIIFAFCSCQTAKYLDSQARSLRIPMFLFPPKTCKRRHLGNSTFDLRLDLAFIGRLVDDVSCQLKWKSIILVNDGTLGSAHIQDITIRLSRHYTSVLHLDMTSRRQDNRNGFAGYIFERIASSRIKQIVIACSRKNGEGFFRLALARGMLSDDYHWLVVVEGGLFNADMNLTAPNILVASHLGGLVANRSECWSDHVSRKYDGSEDTSFAAMLMDAVQALTIAAINTTTPGNINVTLCSQVSGGLLSVSNDPIVENLKTISFEGESGIIQFGTDNYRLDQIFKICSTSTQGDGSLSKVGEWSSEFGLAVLDDDMFDHTFKHFNWSTLRVVTLEIDPFVVKGKTNLTSYTGMLMDILRLMASNLKFRYDIIEPEDSEFGAKKTDGTWTGMVGMVSRGEADLAVGPFTVTEIRGTIIDFIKPFADEGVGIITSDDSNASDTLFRLFQPFAWSVWCLNGLCVVVVGLALTAVAHIRWRTRSDECLDHGFLDYLWLAFSCFMEQGTDPKPLAVSSRIIIGVWWLFTVVMASTYTANLAAFLTVPAPHNHINSLRALADQDKIKPLIEKGTNLQDLFSKSSGDLYSKIWSKMEENDVFADNTPDGIRLVKTGGYAYLTDRSELDYYALTECGRLVVAEETFNAATLAFVVPKKAPYKQAFDHSIANMQESGLIAKWRNKWWPMSKCGKKSSSATSLDMKYLAGPFLLYVAVSVLAGVTVVIKLVKDSCNIPSCLDTKYSFSVSDSTRDE